MPESVKPDMMYRWKNRNRIVGGMMVKISATTWMSSEYPEEPAM